MSSGDEAKTKKQLIKELEDLREKMVKLVALSELDAILEALPDIYFRLDEEGTILDFKAGRPDELYRKPDEFMGKKIKGILPAEVGEKLDQAVREVKDSGALQVFEYSLPTPAGISFYEARLVPFDRQVLSIIRNITGRKCAEEEIKKHRQHLQALVDERTAELETINMQLQEKIAQQKKAEEELKIAKEAAESANRLKSRFLANMSHDIRTPLHVILGFADLVLKGNLDKKSGQYVKKIKQAGDALLTLLNDILDFSKIEAGQLNIYPHTFMVEELRESLSSMFGLQFKLKGIVFEITVAPEVPKRIYGDKWRIHQVLANLLSNALKFTEKGRVTFDTAYYKADDRVRFIVKDTGVGIPKKDIPIIFHPFIRLQSPGVLEKKGTGIGLAICLDLANLLGGNIRVNSKVNMGSEFVFEMPANSHKVDLNKELRTGAMNREITRGLQQKRHNKILIVDDNPVNQELIAEQFRSMGFDSLLLADNGREALHMAAVHNPDLVLMDIRMPEMDGNEAIRKLRRKGFPNPIIALSAFAMREHIDTTLAVGADDYIIKPIDFERFFSRVNSFLKEKKGGQGGQGGQRGHEEPPGRNKDERKIPAAVREGAEKENREEENRVKSSVSGRVREVFINDARKKLGMLTEALAYKNFKSRKKELMVIAHNYKGNAGLLGLGELKTQAEELEKAINKGKSLEKVKQLTQELSYTLKDIIQKNS